MTTPQSQPEQTTRKELNIDVHGIVVETDWKHTFVTNESTQETLEVYAAGPKLVVVINDAERLELNCLDAAAIKTVDGDRRYECGQVMVHRVDNLTIQVSNSLDQACAFRVRANQNTLMIETTKGSYVFKEGQKTTVYVS